MRLSVSDSSIINYSVQLFLFIFIFLFVFYRGRVPIKVKNKELYCYTFPFVRKFKCREIKSLDVSDRKVNIEFKGAVADIYVDYFFGIKSEVKNSELDNTLVEKGFFVTISFS